MVNEFSFKNSFNDILVGNKWEVIFPKANIILVTGMCEYSLRYDKFATYLNGHNFNVYSLDHYGQGKNGELGKPGKDYFFKMIETINELAIKLKEETHLPIYIFAHSMGSFVTQGLIEKYSYNFNKIILCGSNGKTFLFKIANFVSSIYVNKRNYDKKATLLHNLSIGSYEGKFKKEGKNAWLSVNDTNVTNYSKDPYCSYRPTNGFYREFFKGLKSLHNKKLLKNVNPNLKVLIIGGSKDPVSNFSKGLISLNNEYRKYGINSRLIIYENMRHEIINEKNNDEVFENIKDFYEE